MKHLYTGLMATLLAMPALAQHEGHTCGTDEMRRRMIEADPSILLREALFNAELEEILRNNMGDRDEFEPITIPIVFHILHLGGTENITDEKINEAVQQLNKDFNAQNSDLSQVIALFQPIIGNTKVTFKLATKDPYGNCTNGINRVRSVQTFLGEATSKIVQWPRANYLNVWVCRNLPPGVAGYVIPPGGTEGFGQFLDGIMVLASATGGNNNHVISHEMGHMFSLQHTWGQTNTPGVVCGDDGVEDTPITKGSNSGCNLNLQECEPGVVENVQNTMDYSSCGVMFTEGQSARMRALLATTQAERNSLYTEQNLVQTGVAPGTEATCPPEADFYASVGVNPSQPSVPYTPTTCVGTNVRFVDNSARAAATAWEWTFQDGNPATSNVKNPIVQFTSPGWKRVKLVASNAYGSTTKEYDYSVLVGDNGYYVDNGHTWSFEEGEGTDPYPWVPFNHDVNHTFFTRSAGHASAGGHALRLNSGSRNPLNLMNPDNVRDIDEVISPLLNLDYWTSAQLSFKYAYSTQTTVLTEASETLELYSSTDCGRSWSLRTLVQGAELLTGGSSSAPPPFVEKTVMLPASLLTPSVRFKFRFTSSAYSNDLYIDEVRLSGSVGIPEQGGSLAVSLFPNPTEDSFTLRVAGMASRPTAVEITDLRGALVYSAVHPPTGEGIVISGRSHGLADGLYLLRASNDLGGSTIKLMIGR